MLNIDENKLKLLLSDKKNKIERPKFNGIGEIISGISIIITLCLADFSQVTVMGPLHFQIIAWVIAVAIVVFGMISFVKGVTTFYSVDNLFNEITELDPKFEHPFNIVLIKNSRESGRYLLFKSQRWKCWLFPNYRCLDGPYNIDKEKAHVLACLRRDLNVADDIELEYIGNRISYKYSVSDKIDKKYNFHYFQATNIQIYSNKNYPFRFNGKRYTWKTLDRMYANKNIVKKNKDVLDYVRTACDMT